MKERPILFSGPMVRAILEGRKTQTRRVVKPQPPEWIDRLHGYELRKRAPYQLEDDNCNPCGVGFQDSDNTFYRCPYGYPGDRLWVRETWCQDDEGNLCFRADEWTDCPSETGKWRPSIYLPREFSRITLEIAEVRVERVQEISVSDIASEGLHIRFHQEGQFGIKKPCATGSVDLPNGHTIHTTAKGCFEALWDSINGKKYPWSSNPWVWVVSFQRIEQAVREAL